MHAVLAARTEVRGAWIGGSTAFGRDDRFSDIDIQGVCADAEAGAVFDAVEAALEALAPIALRYVVPQPSWHGFQQRFYRLEGCPPTLFVDVCLIPADQLGPFLDPTRHGTPVVLFDPDGLLVPTPDDADALLARFDARLADTIGRFRLFGRAMVTKAVARGQHVEAVTVWHAFVLRPLIEVLRAVHDPLRQDFGPRYVDIDLPPDVYARLAELHYAATLADLVDKLPRAEALFEDAVRQLRGRYSGSAGGA